MSLAQIFTVSVFVLLLIALIIGKWPRYVPALVGAVIVVFIVFLVILREPEAVWRTLSLAQLGHLQFWVPGSEHIESTGINWQTIIFIGGMMVMILGMEKVGFFDWICLF